MNPVFLTRVARASVYPVRSIGILARKSSFIRRDFNSFLQSQRRLNYNKSLVQRSQKFVTPVLRREFASSGSSFSLPSRSIAFFVLSSLGIVGGFYVISYSMQVECVLSVLTVAIKHLQSVSRYRRTVSRSEGNHWNSSGTKGTHQG